MKAISQFPAAGPQDAQPVRVPNHSCAASSQPTLDSPVTQSFQALNISLNCAPLVIVLPVGAQITFVVSVKVKDSHSAESALIHTTWGFMWGVLLVHRA